jgi:hypothetical protein
VALTAGFLLDWQWVTSLWPFIVDETRLGHVFLASITLAIAVPTLWIAASGSIRSAAAGSAELVVTFSAMTIYLFTRSSDGLVPYAIGTGALAAIMLGAFIFSQRQPWIDPRPMPGLVQAAFIVFCVVLVVVATQLVTESPRVFPWPLAAESSVMYGFIFYGAAVYFLIGAIERRWAAAKGQLMGFLAYDLVLIVPFLRHFGNVAPEHRASLIVYTGVLVISGGLAIKFLFVDARTRVIRPRAGPSAARSDMAISEQSLESSGGAG